MATVDGFRAHAVIDSDVEDGALELYLNAAMGYLNRSEVPAPSESEAAAHPTEAALYDLAAYQVATWYEEHRDMIGESVPAHVFGVQGIIHQLKGFFAGNNGG